MIGYFYICKIDGSMRTIDYHFPDPSDSDVVKTMFAKHPPALSVDLQVGTDERVFSIKPTLAQIQAAFAGQ